MKSLLRLGAVALCGLAVSPCWGAEEVVRPTGESGVVAADAYQFVSANPDAYGRRLNRYHNNYGYGSRNYYNNGNYGYRNYDYYGGNYGRVRDYRNHYRNYPNGGYYNGYYSRPGFSIGGGSSRVYFGF
jgi:hypothetical protein